MPGVYDYTKRALYEFDEINNNSTRKNNDARFYKVERIFSRQQ